MVEGKISLEQQRKNERETEAKTAVDTSFETIYKEIARLKSEKEVFLQDISELDKKRAKVDSKIRSWQRIAGFKRKQAGA